MTVTKGVALSLTVVLAGALAGLAGSAAAPPAATSGARLKAISARVGPKGVSLVIEATEPVPSVAVRPDPLTLVLEFRNVGTDGLANSIVPSARSPIASVAVEPTESMGARVSRVRIALDQPVAHHVRSERNTVVVDFDRISDRQAPYVMPPVSRNTPDAMQALQAASVLPAALLAQGAATTQPAVVAQTAASTRPAPSLQAASASLMAALTPAGQATPPQGALGALSAQQPQPAGPPQTAPQAPEQRRYSGRPVSMQFEGLDLRAVLRLFAEISGLNIVIDPTVQGSVDVALTEVPWDQALDIILRANKLGYVIDGTIVRIAPLKVLTDEQTLKRKLADEQALAGDLRVLTKSLSYAKAQDLVALLTKSALSPRGTVQVDPRTNTLIITDLADRIQASPGSDCRARQGPAAGRDRGADRPDEQARTRGRSASSGAVTGSRHSGARQHDEPGVPQQRQHHGAGTQNAGRPARAARARWRRRKSAGGRCHERHRPRARLGQRRVQPRRAAVGARNHWQRPAPLDAARLDPEQRRGGDHAGREDRVSDRRDGYCSPSTTALFEAAA